MILTVLVMMMMKPTILLVNRCMPHKFFLQFFNIVQKGVKPRLKKDAHWLYGIGIKLTDDDDDDDDDVE